jgi:hypothetical protein
MSRTNRALRLLPAILTVWCLGCDAFESVVGSLLQSPEPARIAAAVADFSVTNAGVADVEAADACHCVLGHAAVISVPLVVNRPTHVAADFVEWRPAAILAAPQPLLRPPVA